MFHLGRTPRSRRTLAAACLPYVLVSIFVEFLHVDPQFRARVAPVAVGEASAVASRTSRTDDACPTCLWLRIGVRLGSRVLSPNPTVVVSAEIATPPADWPDSPVQHPTALRGPPAPVFG
jgi:hypothetical protein